MYPRDTPTGGGEESAYRGGGDSAHGEGGGSVYSGEGVCLQEGGDLATDWRSGGTPPPIPEKWAVRIPLEFHNPILFLETSDNA